MLLMIMTMLTMVAMTMMAMTTPTAVWLRLRDRFYMYVYMTVPLTLYIIIVHKFTSSCPLASSPSRNRRPMRIESSLKVGALEKRVALLHKHEPHERQMHKQIQK